jgi:hypothetical protein
MLGDVVFSQLGAKCLNNKDVRDSRTSKDAGAWRLDGTNCLTE